jgi:hypothetical protein
MKCSGANLVPPANGSPHSTAATNPDLPEKNIRTTIKWLFP